MRSLGLLLLMALGMTATSPASADYSPYDRVVNLIVENSTLRVEHRHDWSAARKIGSSDNPFSDDNDYAYLRVADRRTGAQLFRRPVPALTHLWISENSKYVVGMSNIKYGNPYQLVVFSRFGKRLLERDFMKVTWPGVRSSVTNHIYWYREPSPRISIVENEKFATLSVEDPLGVNRDFYFPLAGPGPLVGNE